MISLTHVSKVFEGKRKATALENVNLDVGKGEVVSIIGPSGSGKSTLLNLIAGLDRPTTGDSSAKPAINEFQAILASTPPGAPSASDPQGQLLQQFMQWREKPDAATPQRTNP